MPDKPAAEVAIDAALVRSLVAGQALEKIPDAASLALMKVAEGWDNEVWRLGDELAVRLPRRAPAAPLVRNEQRALPAIAERLRPTGVRVPAPLLAGVPTDAYPWAWSIVPWIAGVRGLDVVRAERAPWAAPLAAALAALHVAAPDDHPINPVRGVPLGRRDTVFHERLAALRGAGTIGDTSAEALRDRWIRGVEAPSWVDDPVWIHGDLHPGNLVAEEGTLVGIIDFGDVTAGDPAYDLAVAWLAFDQAGRRLFRAATATRYDSATWVRARAWAAAVVVMFLTHSDDEPAYAALARAAAIEVIGDD
ncbi:phosphotransferase [Microbacterium allomyrinae]|uniref:Phosphotransferase n=1 Tax=Microbacterium allomyrinae TaxID=2830666 RepID=A0A9X1S2S5_9MICO|nr:phosphotransferase [Microbacterium allomyrinae]MCC2032414.1 phosphotransferase [Microbacterium allomyrinae]